MTFDGITRTLPDWLSEDGPDYLTVLSSRARIARNIDGFTYAHRANDDTLIQVVEEVLGASGSAGFDKDNYFETGTLDELKKTVLVERHLISQALAGKTGPRGVLVRESESSSVMINEEDHLRIQALCPGFNTEKALESALEIEEKLSNEISFSKSDKLGYLTACPTNLGTGLRVSVLLHLPALVLTKDVQRLVRSSGQLGLAVRGYRGEGTDVVGNLFQISSQKSFGRSVCDILETLNAAVRQIVEYEKKAADVLMKDARTHVLDKIWRSVGILKTAHVLMSQEFMNLSSAVRLGKYYGIIKRPEIRILNELMIMTQPGHLQERAGGRFEPSERDIIRADFVRERFVDVPV